jgi:hypothetical protein
MKRRDVGMPGGGTSVVSPATVVTTPSTFVHGHAPLTLSENAQCRYVQPFTLCSAFSTLLSPYVTYPRSVSYALCAFAPATSVASS